VGRKKERWGRGKQVGYITIGKNSERNLYNMVFIRQAEDPEPGWKSDA